MDKLIVGCIQQRMHLPQSIEEFQEDNRRFLRVAANKRAGLVVFPEMGGLMVMPPMLADLRSMLLRRADLARRRRATVWQKLTGGVANMLARWLRADFRRSIAATLDVASSDVWERYCDVFGGLAREFGMVLVAPSAYLPDPLDGVVRNIACVFGSNGDLLGTQCKVVLHPEDVGLAQAGSTWDVISTDLGQLGIMIGTDVMYPEVGRLLAYQGAEMLVAMSASPDVAMYNKVRAGILARMQDNQLFALASFLVGNNLIGNRHPDPYYGKSAIFAPQELTPKSNGVLVEMGNHRSEGVLAAEWDFPALKALWESSDTPVRRELPSSQAGGLLTQLYARLQSLPGRRELPNEATKPSREASAGFSKLPGGDDPVLVTLNDLTVVSSVTSRWPMSHRAAKREDETVTVEDFDSAAQEDYSKDEATADDEAQPTQAPQHTAVPEDETDETDEMEALPGESKRESDA